MNIVYSRVFSNLGYICLITGISLISIQPFHFNEIILFVGLYLVCLFIIFLSLEDIFKKREELMLLNSQTNVNYNAAFLSDEYNNIL